MHIIILSMYEKKKILHLKVFKLKIMFLSQVLLINEFTHTNNQTQSHDHICLYTPFLTSVCSFISLCFYEATTVSSSSDTRHSKDTNSAYPRAINSSARDITPCFGILRKKLMYTFALI